jgi:hypothetical protein
MHASKIYTPNMFDLFKVELFQSGSYIVKEVTDGHRFIVKHIFAEKREKWSRTEFEVIFDSQRETLNVNVTGTITWECFVVTHSR